jgi:hypothetical protein
MNEFANPPAIYRPVPFWSWNEKMEVGEVRRQVDLLAEAGLGGGFIHSRVGLITPYLGEEWFAAATAAIEQCRERGLKVWLYDEDKWPSGFSGGSVPLADEAYRMKALIARAVSEDGEASDGREVYPPPAPPSREGGKAGKSPSREGGRRVPEGAAAIGPAVDGVQVYRHVSPLGYDWFNGTCYADLMSREAMRRFLDDAYESYFKRYGDLYGTEIVAEFTDEPCTIFRGRIPAGAVPFTDELPERFREMHGYDPIEKLHLLFSDAAEAPRFRLHYFRTVNDLFERNFSKQLGDWCAEHNIELTGHYMCEHGLFDQQLWGVKIMPNYRHQGIPGIDHLCRQIDERITAKQCHSVVNQFGKKRMLSELYGVAGGSLTFEDRLWIASQQMVLGVNLLNHHLSLYTMAGCRKRDYPQNMFYPQPWWPLNNVIDEPLSRTCVALSQGRFVGEVLVVHPQESTFVLWRSKDGKDLSDEIVGQSHQWDRDPVLVEARERIMQLDRQVKAVMDALHGAQRTMDFGDETIVADDGEVVEIDGRPRVRIGQMEYPVVVLPTMETIAATTVELLEEFQAAGGTVLLCGQPPRWLDGEESERLQQWVEKLPEVSLKDLASRVAEVVGPAVEVDASEEDGRMLYVHVRDLEDGDRLVYLTNLHRVRKFDAKVRFAGPWQSVHWLDARTGAQRELRGEIRDAHSASQAVEVSLPFAPTQDHLLLLSTRAAGDRRVSLMPGRVKQEQEIPAGAWKIERLDDNAMTLDCADWREGDGEWSSRPMPLVAIQTRLNDLKYDGPLTLRYGVRVDGLSPKRKVHLVVEYPERYRISVNGQRVEYAGLPAWRDIRWSPIDITGMLHDGRNVIELHCEQFQHGDLTSIHDQQARYGTEIEAIYLVGDFSVSGEVTGEKPVHPQWEKWGLPPISVECFEAESLKLTEPGPLSFGDMTVQGLPFYAGRLRLSTDLPEVSTSNGPVVLELERLDAPVAEVEIDGRVIGYFMSHPLQVDLAEALAAGGKRLTITLYGTLRNLLGPHHHAKGESPAVGPHSFQPNYGDGRGTIWSDSPFSGRPQWILGWMRGEVSPSDWEDRYCMVSFGDVGRISVKQAEHRK